MLTAYVITIENHPASNKASDEVIKSWEKNSSIPIVKFKATTPLDCNEHYNNYKLFWNPIGHYSTRNLPFDSLKSVSATNLSKAACAMSHIRLWDMAQTEDLIIVEHDTELIRKLTENDIDMIQRSPYGIVTLWYAGMDPKRTNFFYHPDRSDSNFPDLTNTVTLAGANSAYYIKSWAATKILKRLYQIGYVPCANDTFLSDWFGFDFLASPKAKTGWTDRERLSLHTSSNWLNHWLR